MGRRLDGSESKRIINGEQIRKLKEYGFTPIKGEIYKRNNIPIYCYDGDGYIYKVLIKNLGTREFKRFHSGNKYTLNNIARHLMTNHPSSVLVENQEYKNNSTKLNFYCKKHKVFYKKTWSDMSQGQYCQECGKENGVEKFIKHMNIVGNLVFDARPDLIKYFKNPEDSKKYSIQSTRKPILICPECGEERCDVMIRNVVNKGFSCQSCSDGIPKTEKFCYHLLKSLEINFEREKVFEWSMGKRYDFYLEKYNLIIETDGAQHVEENTLFKTSLKDTIDNDKLKFKLAMDNGIMEFVRIDLRNSSFEWFVENFKLGLGNHFDLNGVEWEEIWIKSQKSFLTKACNLYDDGLNIEEISHKLNIGVSTIRKYIRDGSSIGLCNYAGRSLSLKKNGTLRVIKYDKNLNILEIFDSLNSASLKTGIKKKEIARVCNGIRKSYRGFIWKYEPNE